MQREYILEKRSINKLNERKVKKQLRSIRDVVNNNATWGATAKVSKANISDLTEGTYKFLYSAKLKLEASEETKADLAEQALRKVATTPAVKWEVCSKEQAARVYAERKITVNQWVAPALTDEIINTEFSELVGRDAHLRIIHDSTELFCDSGGIERAHTIAFGEPGAAKTSMFMLLKQFYESHSEFADGKHEIVHCLDATSITKAGLENYLLDKAEARELPKILYLEEVEKYDLNILLPLGSIMDNRGVLTKLNARVDRSAKISMLVWMTCNDENFVKNWHRGYIWSRCGNKIQCVRPTQEEMLNIILPQKIKRMGGDPAWAKPACEFSYDVLKTTDPREILAVLSGRDRLLDGSYQRDRLAIIRQIERKNVKPAIDIDTLS
jgi:hypothetical protein